MASGSATVLVFVLVAALATAGSPAAAAAGRSGAAACERPALKTSVFDEIKSNGNGACTLLRNTCAEDGMLVVFGPRGGGVTTTGTGPPRGPDDTAPGDGGDEPPTMGPEVAPSSSGSVGDSTSHYGDMSNHGGLWNFPARGGANSDALVGSEATRYFVPIRPASRAEPSFHLQLPVFSACTMPVILITDWPYNMGEVFAQLASCAEVYFRQKGMIDDGATLVLATPDGLGLNAFHQVLMSPYSPRRHLISFDELALRPATIFGGQRSVGWAAEGRHVSCFERVVLCKLHGSPLPLLDTARTVLRHVEPYLPVDPLGFGSGTPAAAAAVGGGGGATATTTLRVLIESRSGPVRTIRNLRQILDACEDTDTIGFRAGSFSRLSCKILHTGDTPELYGTQRYHNTIAAVRSAHVLVAVHGAGATNAAFLNTMEYGGTALLEVRPCGFGTRFCKWPDAYMERQLGRSGYPVRFFALNVEDPAQCQPSDYEAAARASPADTPLRGGGGAGEGDFRARDQHLTLAPGTLLAMLRHVGALLRNISGWQAAGHRGALHGYAVPEGLVLGPLCVEDVRAHLAAGGQFVEAYRTR